MSYLSMMYMTGFLDVSDVSWMRYFDMFDMFPLSLSWTKLIN